MLKLQSLKNSFMAGILFLINIAIATAGIIQKNERIFTTSASNPVTIGLPTATKTVEIPAPYISPSFKDVSLLDKITFGVDHSNMSFLPIPAEITVKIKLEQWDKNNTLTTSFPELTLKYQPFSSTADYIDKTVYNFTNAYKYRITIQNITSNNVAVQTLQSNLFIDADIQLERYTNFSSAASQPILFTSVQAQDLDCNNINDNLQVNWQTKAGAEEYQLEWTFVNDYNTTLGSYITPTATNLPYYFKNNSTRITTTANTYNITLTFEHGYLIYRVRGIGRDLTDPSKDIVGVWNVGDRGFVALTSNKYFNQQEHESDKNWQYSVTFAEEGKKKEVISYFDGSLRNRQSVTKINSDKNAIVGETIYDHQGRPAMNVLPVPVPAPSCNTSTKESSIKYYPDFNKVDGGTSEYSRIDFDTDASSADSCNPQVKGMDVSSGASNYYSSSNPDKTGAQAFVPDAEKYPFTQIEYVRDNTGRISRQGGVGPDYQLGNQHETKYFYGWPNQVQLDRMFGSEVGDAAHYKKNLVIDANGQVSVTYLDQEGRTIATSLAGNAPKDVQTNATILEALPTESSAVKNLTIDLFAKDANGKSKANTQNIQADAIVFNSQLLVAYQSDYEFNYDLSIDTLYDACLKDNICFNCVYNLEIKVTDDCGRIVTPLPPSGVNPVKKTVGHFTADANGNVVSFNTTCTSPTTFTHAEAFKLNLLVGNYTVSKILTINSDARDFYVKTYLDTINTSTKQGEYINLKQDCLRSYQSFIDSAMAHLDTADCNISCTTCAKSLQTINGTYYPNITDARDAFVAAGNGTELDFDFLMEECTSPCKEASVCETTYEMLLMDVSPAGQYGEFRNTNNAIAPQEFPLSVYNTSNVLPKNVAGQPPAHWQKPLVKINGSNYSYYLDENGTRSVIHLSPNGNNYSPRVNNTTAALVKFDATGNFYYTYPENLTRVEDFVDNWKESWAKSLVQYHPEYCYYESCLLYGQKQTGYNLTSDEFDVLLQTTDTYAQAVANGLVIAPYTGTATNVVRFIQPGASTAAAPKDPFLFGAAFNNYNTQLQAQISNFQNRGYSMVESAAIAARCGTQYGTAPIPANSPCRQFGKNTSTTHLDQEWNMFKNFYISEKQKLQKQRDNVNATACLGYSGCIGNDNYNPFTSGMIRFGGGPNNYLNSPYFDRKQPCSVFYAPYYQKKKKRFNPDSNLTPPSAEETAYQVYQQTGQCPLAYHLQFLLTTMASKQKLTTTAEPLVNHPEFTQDLYAAISGGIPATFIPYTWAATTPATDNTLSVNINKTGTTSCTIVLDKTGTGINSWNDVVSISQLKYTATTGGNHYFTAVAAITSPSGSTAPFNYKTITGYSCINITGCNFQQQCKANDLANDLSDLWSALNNNNRLVFPSVKLNGSTERYQSFITPAIKNILGTTSNSLIWKFNFSTSVFELYDEALPSKQLVIKFTSFTNGYTIHSLNNVRSFSDIKGNGTNLFTVNGRDENNTLLVTINGNVNLVQGSTSTPVSMGTCGLPDPILCQDDEYKLRADLEGLLKDVLLKKPFNPNTDLTKSPKYTDLIKSYVSPGTEQSTSKYDKFNLNAAGDYKEQVYFNLLCQCKIILSHKGKANFPLLFSNLVDLGTLTPYGNPELDGNLYRFYMVASYPIPGGGGKIFLTTDTIFGESCLPIKICKPSTSPDTVVSPTVPYVNPCIIYQMNVARVNAENAYKQYRDNLITSIADNYNKHCMSAFENFTSRYDDKEYHFTLYYYDQAGNLVRTIPPEGVQLVNMDVTNTLQINQDRTFNRHTFFTDHTLASTYEYNSLNQLVRQNMPDHDPMDVWDYSLPNGIDSRLKVTATQFVTSTKGYLSGYVDINTTTSRGYLYSTDDGGATWTKMNDLVASSLKKIQLLDASNGFAVGSRGIVLKTTDGGNSWDMISLTGINVVTTINDLYFTSLSNGVIIGDDGVILKTVDGGLTFTSIAPGIVSGIRLNSITYDGSNLFIGGTNNNGHGKLFKGVVTNPTTSAFAVSWSALTSIRSTDLVKVQMLGTSNNGFAIGVDGTLLRTSDGGVNWLTLITGLSGNFKKIHFKNINEGVAILETVAGQGQIYKTNNGGFSWELVSAANEYYNDFHFYQNDKGYAVGSNGKVKRLVMSGAYGLVNIVTTPVIPSTTNLVTVYFSDADNGWVASNTGTVAYYTNNANSTTVTWKSVSTSPATGIKEIYFGQSFNSGMALTATGTLYRILFVGGTYMFLNQSGNYADIDENANNVYAFDRTSRTVKYQPKTNLLGPQTTFGVALPPAAAANLVSINAQVSNTIFTAGTGGDLFKGSATAWADNSANISPLYILDVQAAGTNTIYAVGLEGTLLQTTNGNAWKTLPTRTIAELSAIKFNTNATATVPAAYTGLIAGSNGHLAKAAVSAGVVSLMPITLTTSENLNDIALNTVNKSYVAGDHGTVVHIPNIQNPVPTIAIEKPEEDFNGISFYPSTNMVYTVGDNSAVYTYNNASGAKIKAVYTPRLNDVNFVNEQNGYTVGDKGTIRHTDDGGISWRYVLPVNNSGGHSIPPLNGVWTTENSEAIIIGNTGYAANVKRSTVTYNNIGTSNNLYDIAVKDETGYIVGANGTAYRTTSNGSSWSAIAGTPATTLRAIHIFQSNTNFMAVGDQKKVYCYNGSWIPQNVPATVAAGTIFNDVFFHDDRNGYVAGTGGVLLKCSLTSNIFTLGANTVTWNIRPLTGVNGVTAPTQVDITTIDFSSRYNGFIGGLFNTGIAKANYARLLNDESNIFSTRFWYDRLGRMVVSQNTKQYNRKNISAQINRPDYSYTLYDELGRIKEVGELTENTGINNFAGIFGEYINGQFSPATINDTKFNNWINASARKEITRTYYDNTSITGVPLTQENLRKRVASVTYEDVNDNNDQTYRHATHYSYDIHGNVKNLVQDNPTITITNQRYKKIDYDYDLISGKVNLVRYQDGQPDAFYHFYIYDSDNRITDVYTS
ncbi:MAG: YCF48-related protein, partial [Bacteroidota bacterium]